MKTPDKAEPEAEQADVDEAKLESLLLEGLRSGPPTEMTRQDWEDIRREGLARLEASRLP